MEAALLLLALGLVLAGISGWLRRRRAAPVGDGGRRAVYEAAQRLAPLLETIAHPRDLLGLPDFHQGVAALEAAGATEATLVSDALGDNSAVACLALEALTRRRAGAEAILEGLAHLRPAPFWFALRAIAAATEPGAPMIGPVLVALDDSFRWDINRLYFTALEETLRERLAGREPLSFCGALAELPPEKEEDLEAILKKLPRDLGGPLAAELAGRERTAVDREFFEGIGRLWKAEGQLFAEPVIEHPAVLAQAARVEDWLCAERARPVLLVGEPGVGKTSLVRLVAGRLLERGYHFFEAGASELLAGQSYLGELEERLRQLWKRLEGTAKLVWYVPDFHQLRDAGRHRYQSSGLLDVLLPHFETGRLRVLAEVQPVPLQRLLIEKPRLTAAFEVLRLEPLGEAATLELARRWIARHSYPEEGPWLDAGLLGEAWQLAQQFLSVKAAPGNLMELLQATRQRHRAANQDGPQQGPSASPGVEDLLAALSQLTGLPASILDERQGLDLGALRRLFESRVMGQPEAIECLLERIAMIKAGVCDPSRPLGVFLFAGPTGTGKTEIAKTLAEFLFGTADRLIRLDMSEIQTADALHRIVGQTGEERPLGGALVDQIRRQPFSVLLLDEAEKAHPNVWDLFLQVFDDGRLTDAQGAVADFRHAIVIMTSNLGGIVAAGPGLGFGSTGAVFSAEEAHRALGRFFRKELINRIDRVVVFRPLPREVMRKILDRELGLAFQRRGLRNRAWAVEWSEEAVDFLLEKGFSPDLGARPLRRAIEQHLLAPLALATVHRELPQGEQFLFLSSDGQRLTVEFVDPDASGPDAPAAREPQAQGPTLLSIAREPRGDAAEVAVLEERFAKLAACLDAAAWREKKELALSMTSLADFWSSPERFAILGQAEYLDRIASGFKTARSLLDRLRGGRGRDRVPPKLAGRLAEQLDLLEGAVAALEAGRSWEAFLLVEPGAGAREPGAAANDFAAEVAGMYRAWAQRRNMRLTELEERLPPHGPFRFLAGISGFAALDELADEDGLHVLETPAGDKSFHRCQVRVRVAPQPDHAAGQAARELAQAARAAFAAADGGRPRIVRRYRRLPSPLVRDSVRGWRTGRLDLVLYGRFDLIE
ncbi:MAG TPA: AAA family ATPase [Thermoanaerobaculia bacterium]|nr:AAA family ATPase [Thermoanaerobaculia bacterium]